MGNCKYSVPEVLDDFNEFFQERLWGRVPTCDRNWFQDVDVKLREAFSDAAFEQCLARLPEAPPKPPRLDPATIRDAAELREAIRRIVKPVVRWSEEVTKAASCLQKHAPSECKPGHRKLRQLRPALCAVQSNTLRANTALGVCRHYTQWALGFYQWGQYLAGWETDLSGCVNPGYPAIRQLTPPPWPPWGKFDELEEDLVDDEESGESQSLSRGVDLGEIERLSATLWREAGIIASASATGGLGAFPHGLTEINVGLTVGSMFTLTILLKGPDSASNLSSADEQPGA